ncbi:LAQU0S25e00430g1_1 [Lachancea quebecensis]|uniref:Palmitoyltransferase n=1 Tax=Lachancea quebecensis TaxID=1654605 RepID=A0A0P1KXT3_9SACH|nr:LAQU0S25e00430g1_1 [Lachancea quebecensis]
MGLFIWILILPQLVLFLFSPLLRTRPVFRWYYAKVFHPVFEDVNRFRWKYRAVPAFYLTIYAYCTFLFFKDIESLIRARLLRIERLLIIPGALSAPIITGLLTTWIKPKPTYALPVLDAYDELIFHSGVNCRTCKLPKYARTKHCPICNQCVQLADHHCVWANNCIGRGNYQYFYLFLVSNVFLTNYGFLRLLFLQRFVHSRQLLILSILLGCFGVILVIFSYFQFVLVRDGMTTNEENKWLVVHDMVRARQMVTDVAGKYYFRLPANDQESPAEPLSSSKNLSQDPKKFRLSNNSPDTYVYYSTNPYDNATYEVKDPKEVTSASTITNIYDEGGFWKNLVARLDFT